MGTLNERIKLGARAWAAQGKRTVETRVVRDRKGYTVEQHRIDGGAWFTPID